MSTTLLPWLDKDEKAALARHEFVISQCLGACEDVWRAFAEIARDKLYRENYETFDAYLAGKWKLGKTAAYQYIRAAKNLEDLGITDTRSGTSCAAAHDDGQPRVQISERALRPLTGLPADTKRLIWEKATAAAGGVPTAKQVQAAKVELLLEEEEELAHDEAHEERVRTESAAVRQAAQEQRPTTKQERCRCLERAGEGARTAARQGKQAVAWAKDDWPAAKQERLAEANRLSAAAAKIYGELLAEE